MGRVSGKVALVTGSGMGLGRATSLLLAKEGATLFCTDISPEHGEETVRMIRDAGGTADFMRHDVSSVAVELCLFCDDLTSDSGEVG